MLILILRIFVKQPPNKYFFHTDGDEIGVDVGNDFAILIYNEADSY